MANDPALNVTRNDEAHRWEARLDDEVVGFAEYQLTDQLVVFTHTEVDDALEGRGVGGALVRAALDDVRETADRQVLPLCPFVKSWLARHQDYQSLVYGAPASRVRD